MRQVVKIKESDSDASRSAGRPLSSADFIFESTPMARHWLVTPIFTHKPDRVIPYPISAFCSLYELSRYLSSTFSPSDKEASKY